LFKIHLDNTLKDHVKSIVEDFTRTIIKDSELADTLIEFQQNCMVDFDDIQKYPLTRIFEFNWIDYFNQQTELKKVKTNITFNHKAKPSDLIGSSDNLHLLLVELIYYRRRINFGTTSISNSI
jgi:hypothetical protein